MAIQAAIFDMDGLLLDTERLAMQALARAARTIGVAEDQELYCSMIGLNAAASRELMVSRYGTDFPVEPFETQFYDHLKRLYAAGIPVKPDVPELLEALANNGLPLAVATSTKTSFARHKLTQSGLLGHFIDIVGGDQVARSKPAPDIFLEAAGRCGVDPRYCVAFEDSENGTWAALTAGMTVVQVPDLVAPSARLRTQGHVIASSVMDGAKAVGLLSEVSNSRFPSD